VSDLGSNKYLSSRYRQPKKHATNPVLFHTDSITIGHIANLSVGRQRAANSAQSTYWSCHNTTRTQKLNCNHSMTKVVGIVKWNHGPGPTTPKTTGIMSSRRNNPERVAQFGFLGGSQPAQEHASRSQPGPWLRNRDLLLTPPLDWYLSAISTVCAVCCTDWYGQVIQQMESSMRNNDYNELCHDSTQMLCQGAEGLMYLCNKLWSNLKSHKLICQHSRSVQDRY